MFKKILVPVDGSETSWRALNNALEIGRKFNSEIVVVNVIQPYNNAALLAVPLDHSTISRGNSELERIGDKVLAYAKDVVFQRYGLFGERHAMPFTGDNGLLGERFPFVYGEEFFPLPHG